MSYPRCVFPDARSRSECGASSRLSIAFQVAVGVGLLLQAGCATPPAPEPDQLWGVGTIRLDSTAPPHFFCEGEARGLLEPDGTARLEWECVYNRQDFDNCVVEYAGIQADGAIREVESGCLDGPHLLSVELVDGTLTGTYADPGRNLASPIAGTFVIPLNQVPEIELPEDSEWVGWVDGELTVPIFNHGSPPYPCAGPIEATGLSALSGAGLCFVVIDDLRRRFDFEDVDPQGPLALPTTETVSAPIRMGAAPLARRPLMRPS